MLTENVCQPTATEVDVERLKCVWSETISLEETPLFERTFF